MTRLCQFFRVCLSIFFFVSSVQAADYGLVGRELLRILQDRHYERRSFDAERCDQILEEFLVILDGEKIFLMAPEVAGIQRRYREELASKLSTKAVMPVARGIFELYRERVKARLEFLEYLAGISELLPEADEAVLLEGHGIDWPLDGEAMQRAWKDSFQRAWFVEQARREGGSDDENSAMAVVLERMKGQYQQLMAWQDEDLADAFFSAMTRSYDPHSEYLSAEEVKQFKVSVSNELVGIGIGLEMNDSGELEIISLIEDSPAHRHGEIQVGDRLMALAQGAEGDWKSVEHQSLAKVVGQILGEDKSVLGIRLRRGSETIELELLRELVVMTEKLPTALLLPRVEEGLRLAILSIPSFYFDFSESGRRVSADVETLLTRLVGEEIDGLVLDLRDNGGGSLSEVQRITGFFTGAGPVVQVRSAEGEVTALESLDTEPLYDGPMVVLVNRESASATEILAGALQDYRRAVLIGAPSTYGKGTVQRTVDLSDYMPIFSDRDRAGWLKLTFQKYYRVSGSSVQLRGVVPDLVLPPSFDLLELGEVFERRALPHDVIAAAEGFEARTDDLFLPILTVLKERSTARVKVEPYFANRAAELARESARREAMAKPLTLSAYRSLSQEKKKVSSEEDTPAWEAVRFTRLTLEGVEKGVALTEIDPEERESLRVLEDFLELRKSSR